MTLDQMYPSQIDPNNASLVEKLGRLTKEQREMLNRRLVRDPEIHLPSPLQGLRLAHSLVRDVNPWVRSGVISVAMTSIDNACLRPTDGPTDNPLTPSLSQ